jgi:hypothetical protein
MSPQQGAPALTGRDVEVSFNLNSQRVSEDGARRYIINANRNQ